MGEAVVCFIFTSWCALRPPTCAMSRFQRLQATLKIKCPNRIVHLCTWNTVLMFAIDISLCWEVNLLVPLHDFAGEICESHKKAQESGCYRPRMVRWPIKWQKIRYKDWLYTIINNYGMIKMCLGWILIKVLRLWI